GRRHLAIIAALFRGGFVVGLLARNFGEVGATGDLFTQFLDLRFRLLLGAAGHFRVGGRSCGRARRWSGRRRIKGDVDRLHLRDAVLVLVLLIPVLEVGILDL